MRFLSITFCAILILALAPQSSPQTFQPNPDSIPLAPAVNYRAGSYPASVFCADLDGDN